MKFLPDRGSRILVTDLGNLPIFTIFISFRLPSCSLSAWIGCSTRLTPVSSHHRVPQGPRGPRCCLGYGRCPLQFICQECMKKKRYFGVFNAEKASLVKKYIYIYFLYKRIQDYFAALTIISTALSLKAST